MKIYLLNNTMNNKLRSVIDNKINACKGIYGFFPKDDRTNDQELCVKVELVELLIQEGLEEVLDAIIEDMEKEESNRGKEFININKEKDPTGRLYNLGGIQALTDQINKLKQARAEISTSLTQ